MDYENNDLLYAPKPNYPLTKKDMVFALCAVVVCVFTAVYGVFGGFALGYLLSCVCMLTLFVIYFAKGSKRCAFSILCGVLALGNAGLFICTTNGSVRFFGVVVSFLLSLMCIDGLKNGKAKGNRQTLQAYFRAGATLENIEVSVKSLFAGDNKKVVGKVFAGILCALPVLVVVVPLLLSSDFAFQGMMEDLFSNTYQTIFKIAFGVMLSVIVVTYGLSLKYATGKPIKVGNFAGVENVYLISFLSAISACYVLYLFSQLAYFFSAFRGFLPDEKITYAQYARKGFFEMCVIAVINLIVVFTVLCIAKKKNGKVCHGIKALATFIAVFTLLIIATAISKMVLYIGEYGMTVKRVTTSAFMVFLVIVYISVILRIYSTKINILKTGLVTAGCIVLILGFANVNHICARYNYESYRSGKLATIDVEALYFMGDEGIPYIVKLASDEDKTVAEKAKNELKSAYLHHYFEDVKAAEGFTLAQLQDSEKNAGFSYFSIPRKAAYDSLYDYLKQNPDFDEYCKPKKGSTP